MKFSYYTGILFVIILLLPNSSSFALTALTPGVLFHVTQVHDGATLSIRVKSFAGIPLKTERVRLIGIRPSEAGHSQRGRQAKKYLKEMIGKNGWVVNVEYDVQQRDRHGRLLAYLWNKKGELINEKLLEAGYAVLYTAPPNLRYADRLAAAAKKNVH